MSDRDREDTTIYVVVMNGEVPHALYSVWPVDREIPPDWRSVGLRGTRTEVVAHIEKLAREQRPKSLRPVVEIERLMREQTP